MHWQLLIAVLVVSAPAPADKEKKDEEKIQGTWTVVSMEEGGRKSPDEDVKKTTLVFKDNGLTVYDRGKGEKAKFKLDQAKKPKTIDALPEEKAPGVEQILGIYELKDDELKICFGKDGAERPTEFATKAGSRNTLIVLKREKKDK
jgi:uncharacterized protein (TIGR03067 family)